MSGLTPSEVNGISHSGMIFPTVPFCPCLELNLSPITGFLTVRNLTLANVYPSPFLSI